MLAFKAVARGFIVLVALCLAAGSASAQGTLIGWGRSDMGVNSPPSGSFRSVATGMDFRLESGLMARLHSGAATLLPA